MGSLICFYLVTEAYDWGNLRYNIIKLYYFINEVMQIIPKKIKTIHELWKLERMK